MKGTPVNNLDLQQIKQTWNSRWQDALSLWSRFTRLSEPRWCLSEEDERREGLEGSFAMIRLVDQAVVISLRQVAQYKLEKFPLEVLGHEIGHHVYCPGDLVDQSRVLARVRAGLPTKEHLAGFISNLYEDLLINYRLQRSTELDMAGIYRALGKNSINRLWTFYMRIYEILWSLQKGALAGGTVTRELEADAILGARLIRAYQREWIVGAGRFACLCLPYLLEDEGVEVRGLLKGWLDTDAAGAGAEPFGLTEIEDDEEAGAIHPALDPTLNDASDEKPETDTSGTPKGQEKVGGSKNTDRYRGIFEYGELLKALGVALNEQAVAVRYYRERALPHLVRFPMRENVTAVEPHPEGLEEWEIGDGLERVDWFESVVRSPHVIPGITTLQRTYGETSGSELSFEPIDLYIGIDCSGSMPNPQRLVSYPALAGTILALSALRVRAKVKVVLSGEPGKTHAMREFSREEREVLGVLTTYLGTGTAFGIHRLSETFNQQSALDRPAHIVIITDQDIFSPLNATVNGQTGWVVAENALRVAKGGGTFVLHMPGNWKSHDTERLIAMGWNVYRLYDWQELINFARDFSRRRYQRTTP